MSQTVSETPKVPKADFFIMKFKFKGVIATKSFKFTGSLREATERAKQHCLVQGYSQHIWTEHLFHDLDVEDDAIKSKPTT